MTENLKGLNLNNEKIMREKAEQMAKNAEMKIQKAQLKEQKYQQDLEFQKKNNPNFRDYDKDPLIIQSYEEFFVLIMFLSSLLLSLIISYFCKELYKGSTIYASEYVGGFCLLFGYIFVISIFQKTHFSHHKIKFTNRYIEFYDYGKLKRQCEIISDELVLPFSEFYSKKSKLDSADIFIYLLLIAFILVSKGFVLLIVICFYFSNFFIKFIIYLLINKNLKGFKIFPFIQISKPTFLLSYKNIFAMRYYLIYMYNYQIYKEVKKYFLQQGVNINNLPKKYSVI